MCDGGALCRAHQRMPGRRTEALPDALKVAFPAPAAHHQRAIADRTEPARAGASANGTNLRPAPCIEDEAEKCAPLRTSITNQQGSARRPSSPQKPRLTNETVPDVWRSAMGQGVQRALSHHMIDGERDEHLLDQPCSSDIVEPQSRPRF